MFVPGHRQKMIDKSFGLANIDAVMLDIEDGVAPSEKDAARREIAAALERVSQNAAAHTPARYVRINAIGSERMYADLASVIRPGIDGLVLPKVDSPDQVEEVEAVLDHSEPEHGIERRKVQLLIAIESPRGLFRAQEIAAASARVIGLIFGAEDFGKEMGLPLRREGEARDLIYARSAFVCAAAAQNVQAVDGVWPDLQDAEGLKAFALQSRRLGFTGMSSIHPSQIDAINAAFSPSPDEIEYCKKVVQAFDEARARGEGSIAFGGQLIDLPIVERARRTLALAAVLGS
jgi:citrate lyase subunit beta/citryl-CoA lyase